MLRDLLIDDIIEGVINVIENPAIEPKIKVNKSTAPYEIYNIGNNNPLNSWIL